MRQNKTPPKVLVVIPTYNGEKYIEQQILSIQAQERVEVRIVIRDDVSTDRTSDILKKYRATNLKYNNGLTNIGTIASLKNLIQNVEEGEYLALADQDDIWLSNHLWNGIQELESAPKNSFNLYFPEYSYIDSEGNRLSNRQRRNSVGLQNALVENPAIGCGIILNQTAAIMCKHISFESNIHIDYQLYFLASAMGHVIQGDAATVHYRLHGANQIGIPKRGDFRSLYRALTQIRLKQNGIRCLSKNEFDQFPQDRQKIIGRHFEGISGPLAKRLQYSLKPSFQRERALDQFVFQILCLLGLLNK